MNFRTQKIARSRSLGNRPSELGSVVRRRSFQPKSSCKSTEIEFWTENSIFSRSHSVLIKSSRSSSKKCRSSTVYHIKRTLNSSRRGLVHLSKPRKCRNKQKHVILANELGDDNAVNLDEEGHTSFNIRHQETPCTARFVHDSVKSENTIAYEIDPNVSLDGDASENTASNNKKVKIHEALWFTLAVLSFWGLNIYIFEDKAMRISRLKVFLCIIHMILVIFAFGYTVNFLFTQNLPLWFRIFTMSFAFTHLFAFLHYVMTLTRKQKVVQFFGTLNKLSVKYFNSLHIIPMGGIIYSLFSMMMLFYVMPEQSYEVSLLIVSSLFMPGTVDHFLTSVLAIFTLVFQDMEKTISTTSRWTIPKVVKLSKQLRFTHKLIESFNQVSIYFK